MSASNIVRCFFDAPESVRESGSIWYATARGLAEELSPNNVALGAGVIAALSPMMNWPRNMQLARDAFNGIRPACLNNNADKAMRIAAGADPLTILGGQKVISFYHNIMGNDVAEAVTIDRHAVDIAVNFAGAYNNSVNLNKSNYRRFVREYMIATKVINRLTGQNYTAAQIQAITWTHWRMTSAQMYFAGKA